MLENLKVENIVLRMFKTVLLLCLFFVLFISAGCRTATKEPFGSKSKKRPTTNSDLEEIEDTHFQSLRLRSARDTEELGVIVVSPDGKVRHVK